MKIAAALVVLAHATVAAGQTPAEGVTSRDVRFFSEGVQCYAKLYLPKGFGVESKTPAVVLAPGWMQTEESIDAYAAHFAARGLVAMAIDYRSWGRSGGYLYLAEPVRVDDRQRFSQHTAKVRIRRKRSIPFDQVLDIRNAVAFLQGEPGVDRARVGIWGTDMAGGHVVVAVASDARIKAAVAQVPIIDGASTPKQAAPKPSELHAAEIRSARAVPAPGAATSDVETRLALSDYHPFWYADQVPPTTAMLFIVAERDGKIDNEQHAVAASKLMKGPTGVTVLPGATHAMSVAKSVEAAADAAASWFLKYL